MSNAFCEQALNQNSLVFFKPSCFAPSPPPPKVGAEVGRRESSHSFLPESLCFALWLASIWVTLPIQWQHVWRDTEPVSCPCWRSMSRFLLQLPRGASPSPHLTQQLCVVAAVRPGCWALAVRNRIIRLVLPLEITFHHALVMITARGEEVGSHSDLLEPGEKTFN